PAEVSAAMACISPTAVVESPRVADAAPRRRLGLPCSPAPSAAGQAAYIFRVCAGPESGPPSRARPSAAQRLLPQALALLAAGRGRCELVGLLLRELCVEHRVLGFLNRRERVLDREGCILRGAAGVPLGVLVIELSLPRLEIGTHLRGVLVPGALEIMPPDRQLAFVGFGRRTQLVSLSLSGDTSVLDVLLEVGSALARRCSRAILRFLGAGGQLAQLIRSVHLTPPCSLEPDFVEARLLFSLRSGPRKRGRRGRA